MHHSSTIKQTEARRHWTWLPDKLSHELPPLISRYLPSLKPVLPSCSPGRVSELQLHRMEAVGASDREVDHQMGALWWPRGVRGERQSCHIHRLYSSQHFDAMDSHRDHSLIRFSPAEPHKKRSRDSLHCSDFHALSKWDHFQLF